MKVRGKGAGARSGFTLVEVLVSMVVLVMVMGGAYSLVVQAASLSRAARDHYVAVNLAKNRLERARNFQYADLRLVAESSMVVDENGNPNTLASFKRTTAVNTNYAANLTQITVTVHIRNFRTGLWSSQEQMSSLFASF
ncbi:MAG: prepilin-type N-terminal cleavage/methylation domain-containing protein [bacterium]